jgi:ABC-type transport system substrate-binding protein
MTMMTPGRWRRRLALAAVQIATVSLPLAAEEAPDLAAAVAAGTLPPLAERLPADPLVVTPHESVGTYGGTWRSAVRGTGDSTWIRRTIGYDSLVRWDPTFKTIEPNLAAPFEVSPDAKTYTFTLRDGVKWSDGAPFTAADIQFWYDQVLANEEVDEGMPSWFETSEGECAISSEGTLTVIFQCPAPNGLLLENLAGTRGEQVISWPKHYLAPFPVDTGDAAAIEAAIAAEGVETWVELFLKKADWDGSPYFNETLATQFTAFDEALANEHLDKAGLTERDGDGNRLGPDGQPVRVTITVRIDLDEVIQSLELVRGHWARVGITLDLDVVERSLFRTRTRANEHDAAADNAEGGGKDFFLIGGIVSGEAIISVVLNLPTTGPLLLQALKAQDMYLAASFIPMLSVLTVIGTPLRLSRLADAPQTGPILPPEDIAVAAQSAGQWRLIWRRFRRHRLALVGGVVVLAFYLVALLAEFIAPFAPDENLRRYASTPPQEVNLFDRDDSGYLIWRPHVVGFDSAIDTATRKRTHVENPEEKHDIAFSRKSSPTTSWA